MRILRHAAAVLAGALALAPTPAQAGGDDLRGDLGGASETDHRVDLRMDRGHARLTVRRTLRNDALDPDQLSLRFTAPEGAVATGLRVRDERRGKRRWHRAKLQPAEAALDAFRGVEDPRKGPGNAEPSALLSELYGEYELRTYPVAPAAELSVEYELLIPARWERGYWHLELPALGSEFTTAELHVEAAHGRDRVYVDGARVRPKQAILLDERTHIELAPHRPDRLELSLASVDTGGDRRLVQLQVSAAPQLSELPRRAQIVIALDLSRSQSDGEVEAQRAAALAYLDNFADPKLAAEVAIVGFDHELRPLGPAPGFVDVAQAKQALADADLQRRNGSEIGLAIAHAKVLFAEHGRRGAPRRVLLLTDFRGPSRVELSTVAELARASGAVVHTADVLSGQPQLTRADGHPWAGLAAGTGGVHWRAVAQPDAHPLVHELAVSVYEEWARPLRIDALELGLEDVPELADELWPERLDEGEGVAHLTLAEGRAGILSVDGLLWNQPIHADTRASKSHGDLWSALVFGDDLHGELDEDEMMSLATRGGAVSPVTSYVHAAAGERPESTWGYGTTCGCGPTGLLGRGGGVGRGRIIVTPRHAQRWLDRELGELWAYCGGAGVEGAVELESTSDEIVDLDFELPADADPTLEPCMRKATWSLHLPEERFIKDRARWRVEL